jgi:nitrogenase-stabilizing/protective protein
MEVMDRTIDDFFELTDAEDYFEFFEIEFDKSLVNIKRFHIMKEYGAMIKTGFEKLDGEDEKLLDFLKFSLLKVYGDFKNGYAPSAAAVWGMFENGKLGGCMSCTPQVGNSCGC